MREKLNSDFKQKHWDEKQKLAVAQVARALEEFDSKNGSYAIENVKSCIDLVIAQLLLGKWSFQVRRILR